MVWVIRISSDPHAVQRPCTQGYAQFLASKKEMLDDYDRSKDLDKADEVETDHGKVAEAKFREWLSNFLPKKYAVTPGYIVSQGMSDEKRLPHFDVIIYDHLESPVLWIKGNPDLSQSGSSRAIPAEHVRAVIEVKSSFTPRDSKNAIDHLFDLEPLLVGDESPNTLYKKYLPLNFISVIVFFELIKKYEFSKTALNNLVPEHYLRGYIGGLILRGEGLSPEITGQIMLITNQVLKNNGKSKRSLLVNMQSKFCDYSERSKCSTLLIWHEAAFAMFAFELIALLNGTSRPGIIPSLHAMPFFHNY